jgi:signal transduction histidine kinase
MAATRGAGTDAADERSLVDADSGTGLAAELARANEEVALLRSELRRRAAEQAIVDEIIQSVAAQRGFTQIVEAFGERAAKTLAVRGMSISTVDEVGDLTFHFWVDEGVRDFNREGTKLGDALSAEIVRTNRAIRIASAEEAAARGTPFKVGGTESYLGVPIPARDRAIGVFALGTKEKNAYTDSDEQLAQTMASAMGVALQNAELVESTRRLLAESNQRVVELEIVNEVGRALARQLEFGAIVEAVGDRTTSALGVLGLSISIVDPQTDELTFYYWNDEGVRRSTMERIVLGDELSKEILRTNRAVRIGSAQEAEERGTPFKIGGTESYVGVPIPAGNRAIGVFAIGTREQHAYTDAEERILGTLASTMGVALENARLVEETRQRAEELATINEVVQAVAAQPELEPLIAFVGDQIGKRFPASDVTYVALLDQSTQRIEFPYYAEDGVRRERAGLTMGEGLASRILATHEALMLNNSAQFEQIGTRGLGRPARSYVGVPITVRDEAIGVISIQSSTDENMFGEADKRLLSTLAANVGTAIQRALLFTEMEQAKEQAEAANAAKSTFLAGVSHELRTPLTSVLGFAKVIRRQLDERIIPHVDASDERTQRAISQVRDNIDIIAAEGERLTSLVNNVLDLAKIEAGAMEWRTEPTQMADVIDRALAATAGLLEAKGLAMEREVADDLPEMAADRDGLIQVVINLISNAVKFTDHGAITCRATLTVDGIEVSVEDSGMGISPSDQARVFDKFSQVGDTLTDKPHGTGLGLTICREIVEWHGGRIWVQSKLGEGSTFSFVIPLKPPVRLSMSGS